MKLLPLMILLLAIYYLFYRRECFNCQPRHPAADKSALCDTDQLTEAERVRYCSD